MKPSPGTPEIPSPLPPRPVNGHKGTFGRVLIVAGSWQFPGAAVLAARGALRAGAGLVCVAVPECLHPTLAVAVPAATWQPLASRAGGGLTRAAGEDLLAGASANDAVALGMGLGGDPETVALVSDVVEKIAVPLVLDADGLNALSGRSQILSRRSSPTILTPHPGEMQRLTGCELPRNPEQRRAAAIALARETGAIVLLKGPRTVISDGQRIVLNTTGNPGMATGGSGDVLSGIITAFLGQGLEPFQAAWAGAYVHGLAGDLAADRLGETALTAEDLIELLPFALTQWNSTHPC